MNRDASTKNAYRSQTWSRLDRKICACVSRNTQNQNRQSWRGNIMACQNSKRHSWRQEAEHTRESPQPEIEGKCWSQKKSRLKTASLYEPVSTLVLQLRCLLWHCAIPCNVSFHVKISCRFPYRLAKGYAFKLGRLFSWVPGRVWRTKSRLGSQSMVAFNLVRKTHLARSSSWKAGQTWRRTNQLCQVPRRQHGKMKDWKAAATTW